MPPTSKPPKEFINPFTVAIDTREQRPYAFVGLRTNSKEGNRPIKISLERMTLDSGRGDYSIVELPIVAIERKSKEDLYQSINPKGSRAIFESRTKKMNQDCRDGILKAAHVVVECDVWELHNEPPKHTDFSPKSLWRTIIAWSMRFERVHWWFMPGRENAEAHVFRLLERTWAEFGPNSLPPDQPQSAEAGRS